MLEIEEELQDWGTESEAQKSSKRQDFDSENENRG
jgi:hypothetical protein